MNPFWHFCFYFTSPFYYFEYRLIPEIHFGIPFMTVFNLGNVDWNIYLKWFVEMLIPELQQFGSKVVLIMDNASYHSCKVSLAGTSFEPGKTPSNARKVRIQRID